MDTSDSPRTVASENTPLFPAEASQKPKTPLPKRQISILMMLQLAEPIASTSIFPYINQLISELGITGGDDAAVGYYAGIIVGGDMTTCENGFLIVYFGYTQQESLFFVAQALTVLRWSRLSDRIGRKPVLVIGLSGACISILCFGLSTTFWSLVISRCTCGFLNGNVGVMKTMMGELTDSTNMAQAFALFPIVWSLGGFVGPLIGGALARPQDHWPALFANPFWGKYPYFLPCAVAACLFILAFFMMLIFLEETLSTKCRPKLTSATLGVSGGESLHQQSMAYAPLRSLLTPTVVVPIANYAMLAFLDVSFRALLPLFLSTPTYLGGLEFTPSSIGSWLAFFGVMDGVFQALFFAKIVDRFGPKRLFFLMVAWDMAFGTVFMFITASAPTNTVLGAINGLGQTSASMARALGPALATSLFAVSKERNILAGNAAYVVLIMLAGVLRWLGSQLPDEVQDRNE
ncbi:major facilitator superfamily domain-containing protein [Suillus subaureus]|uniref:Major facilitator superfamily domain-containing protein n=1 Tax=Suillus subaureus TaxID=48587 RepID=A0A9P7JHY0_9AGAM|nr:major facilitator superfamily domain-containing protein [Suillus subaureus]KAG1822960.1 major facilitator superfamily domain-containing protein [Suillus subaureus]